MASSRPLSSIPSFVTAICNSDGTLHDRNAIHSYVTVSLPFQGTFIEFLQFCLVFRIRLSKLGYDHKGLLGLLLVPGGQLPGRTETPGGGVRGRTDRCFRRFAFGFVFQSVVFDFWRWRNRHRAADAVAHSGGSARSILLRAAHLTVADCEHFLSHQPRRIQLVKASDQLINLKEIRVSDIVDIEKRIGH